MARQTPRNEFSSNAANKDVAKKTIVSSENYAGVRSMVGEDPKVRISNQDSKLYHTAKDKRVTVGEYAHFIYGWLLLNPKMLSVSDYYEYELDNAPFIYTLDEVLEYDSDEIYNLLQERLTKMMLRRQIDRESALAVLREKYGWQRDNEQNINLNTNAKVSFKFGDQNLNQPQLETDNDKKE